MVSDKERCEQISSNMELELSQIEKLIINAEYRDDLLIQEAFDSIRALQSRCKEILG